LYRYDCSNCDSVYVKSEKDGDITLLKGEIRDWPEYLSENLKFPFEVMIIEENDRAFFDLEYDCPRRYDNATVLEVFYSMKYGVEALIRIGRKTYHHLLCWVEVLDENSPNSVEIENYKRWREKHWRSDYLMALFGTTNKNKQE